jgi:hypothetical protein
MRELADAGEIRVRGGVGLDAQVSEPLEHHQRVVGAAAERLGAGQQIHQVRIVAGSLLNGPPGEVVEGLEIAACGRRLRLRAAVSDVSAGRTGSGLEQEKKGEKKRHRKP